MATRVEDIVKDALRQGWRITPGAKHKKLWDPTGRRYRIVPHVFKEAENPAMFEREMRKMGWRPEDEIKAEEKQKERVKVASVQDLIKANGEGVPVVQTKPEVKSNHGGKRAKRVGLDRDILVAIKAGWPQSVDFTTIKMKVSMNHPGSESSIHNYLSKLKIAGKIVSTGMGMYRLANADVVLDGPTAALLNPVNPVLPGEYKAVIDGLINSVDAAEKLIIRLTRQLAEQTEATEIIKRLAAKL